MKRIYFLFAIIAIVVLTTQTFSEADADADGAFMTAMIKKLCENKRTAADMEPNMCQILNQKRNRRILK
uniref:Venom peptide ECTX1-Rm15a n=1 Tax=Rhytidoponera metallica TaxID=148364 RepID=A0A8U0LTH4_RHYMT|nr:venom peptide precursor ECTX1-Rm15a [Rhytidoponera metallica]